MGLYYISLFSIVPLGIAYVLLALVYWAIAIAAEKVWMRGSALVVVGAIFLVLPISEEIWIAWNFGQACKEAGTSIHKKVHVDGFYDDTRSTHTGVPTWQAIESFEKSGYQFFEMRGGEKFVRIERISGQWKSISLDRPTARYHYRMTDPMNGTPWAYKIVRTGAVVIDTENNLEIARYTSFGRSPPWFYFGLGTPSFACDAPERWPRTSSSHLIYSQVLLPTAQR